MLSANCPTEQELRDYIIGRLGERDLEPINQHVLACTTCENTITRLEQDSDTLVELLRKTDVPEVMIDPKTDGRQPRGNEDRKANKAFLPELPKALGQYELLSILGHGGMGAVYLARHQSLDKKVAVKILPPLPSTNGEFVARFQREMRTAGKLDHPAIVRTTDAGEQEGFHFLVMEVIDGWNLSQIASLEGCLRVADACELIRQAAIGLAYAHEKGIVHRDIKPSNLMLDREKKVRILDFGLAQVGFWDSEYAEITTVGQLMGTLDYMAPEQAERGGAVDYRADLYSLGATLFRLLTGRPPLAPAPDLSPLEKLRLLATSKAPRLRSLIPSASQPLSEVVDALLSRNPSQRPASAIHVAESLEPFCRDADLATLLQRAAAQPPREDSARNIRPRLRRSLKQGEHEWNTEEDAKPSHFQDMNHPLGGRTRSPWRTVLVALLTGAFSMIFAGILFILETSKGSLVITSEVDAHIKLLRHDETGEAKDLGDIVITPGAQVTRLKSGRYEIILDGPSDAFTINNGAFSIRNGETVIATITPKLDFASGSNPPIAQPALSLATNEVANPQQNPSRPPEATYQGRTLQEWLQSLQVERDEMAITEAIQALSSLEDASNRSQVREHIIAFLRRSPSYFKRFPVALIVLHKCSGEEFLNSVNLLIEEMAENERPQGVLALMPFLADPPEYDSASMERLLSHVESALHHADSEEALKLALAFRRIAFLTPAKKLTSQLQSRVLFIFSNTPTLTLENFWLSPKDLPVGGEARLSSSKILLQEIARKALAVLDTKDAHSEPPPATRALAWIVLRLMIQDGYTLSDDEKTQLHAILRSTLEQPDLSLVEVNIERVTEAIVLPRWLSANMFTMVRQDAKSIAFTNLQILALNTIEQAGLQERFQDELQTFLKKLDDMPLCFLVLLNVDSSKPLSWDGWMRQKDEKIETDILLAQFLYGQTASMLGESRDAIYARFRERRLVDEKYYVRDWIRRYEKDPTTSIGLIKFNLPREPDAFVAEFLRKHFANWIGTGSRTMIESEEKLELWIRSAGEGFMPAFAELILESTSDVQEILLSVDLSKYSTLICSDPSSLERLFQLSGHRFEGQANILDNVRTSRMLRFLRNLLSVRSKVGMNGQRAIIEHLGKFPQLTDETFWLNHQTSNTNNIESAFSFAAPMRAEKLRRAIELLESRQVNDGRIRCQAWMIARRYFSELTSLPEAYSQKLQRAIVETCSEMDLMNNREAMLKLELVPSIFEPDTVPAFAPQKLRDVSALSFPIIDRVKAPRYRDLQPIANEFILAFNLLLDQPEPIRLQLTSQFQNKLVQLCDTVEMESFQLHPSGFDTTSDGTVDSIQERTNRSWVRFVGNRLTHGGPTEPMVLHSLHLQAAALLQRDVNALANRPFDRYRESEQKRIREIQPRDTLSIFIPGILPQSGDPPVLQAGTKPPVIGYPVVVTKAGTIELPILGTVETKELTPDQLRESIVKKAVETLGTEPKGITVQFLVRSDELVELRNIAGPNPLPPKIP